MTYPIITNLNGKRLLGLVESGAAESKPVELADIIESRPSSGTVSDTKIAALVKPVHKIVGRYARSGPPNDEAAAEVEADLCVVVHTWYRDEQIPLRAASDLDFWRYLALAHFEDVVRWRYKMGDQPAKASNYGVTAPRENLFYRAWLRGSIGYEPTSSEQEGSGHDPYALARGVTQIDVWRSHIFRQSFCRHRPLAVAFVRLQAGKIVGQEPLKKDEVRLCAKALSRQAANENFPFLDDTDALRVVCENADWSRAQVAREAAAGAENAATTGTSKSRRS